MDIILRSVHVLDLFWKLRSFTKCDRELDINPGDEALHTNQYQEVFLKCVENESCPKHRHVPILKPKSVPSNYRIPSATAPEPRQSSFDHCDMSSDDEEYLTCKPVAKITPRQTDHTVHLPPAGRLYFISPHEQQQNWGQVDPDVNNYHSDPMAISNTCWLLDVTDWR